MRLYFPRSNILSRAVIDLSFRDFGQVLFDLATALSFPFAYLYLNLPRTQIRIGIPQEHWGQEH
jgi:hypothetical protein